MNIVSRQLRHKSVAVPGASTQLFGASVNRVAVYISADTVNYLCVSFGEQAADHTGFQIIPIGQGLLITKEMIGEAINQQINCFASGATAVACVEINGT